MALANYGHGVSIPKENRAVISTGIDIWARLEVAGEQIFRKIGFAQQISPTFTRNTTPIRHLDKNAAGRIIEQQPQPEEVTFQLVGFEVYDFPLPARLLGNSGRTSIGSAQIFNSLASQAIPFTLVEWAQHPGDKTKNVYTIYYGCWMTNWTRTVTIGTTTVSTTVQVRATRVEQKFVSISEFPDEYQAVI